MTIKNKTKEEFSALFERIVRTMRACDPSLTMDQAFEMVAWHSVIESAKRSENVQEFEDFINFAKAKFVEAWLKSEQPSIVN